MVQSVWFTGVSQCTPLGPSGHLWRHGMEEDLLLLYIQRFYPNEWKQNNSLWWLYTSEAWLWILDSISASGTLKSYMLNFWLEILMDTVSLLTDTIKRIKKNMACIEENWNYMRLHLNIMIATCKVIWELRSICIVSPLRHSPSCDCEKYLKALFLSVFRSMHNEGFRTASLHVQSKAWFLCLPSCRHCAVSGVGLFSALPPRH